MPQASRYVLYQQSNPLRRPAWRYERALEASKPKRFHTDEDPDVTEAVRMLRLLRSGTHADPNIGIRVFYRFPDLYRAYEVFQAGVEGPAHARSAIESRLLAGQGDNEIAAALSMQPSAVATYERVFFNVRDRLLNKDYIVGQVLMAAAENPANLADFTPKFFGYFGGPFVVEAILNRFDSSCGRPKSDGAVKGFLTSHLEKATERRLAEIINSVTIDKYNVVPLLEIHARITQDMRRREAESAVGGSEYEQNMKTWMDVAVPWSIGTDNREAIIETYGEDAFAGAMEPRANELLAITDGANLPKLNYTLDRERETEHDSKTKRRKRKSSRASSGEGADA